MSSASRSLIVWFFIFGAVVLLWQSFQKGYRQAPEISFNEFQELVEDNRIATLTIRDREVSGTFKAAKEEEGGKDFRLHLPFEPSPQLIDRLVRSGIEIYGRPVRRDSPLLAIFLTWGPVLLIVGLWIFFMRVFQARGNQNLAALRRDEGEDPR